MKTIPKNIIIVLGILLVHLVFLVKVKFTAWPEMLLWPYLMIKGWLPYVDIAIVHTPLMLIKLLVFFKIFGLGITQLKIFTWIFILIFDFLVYFTSKRLLGVKVAAVAVAFFVFWQVFFDGNGLWFDLFMGMAAFVSYYFIKTKHFTWAGIFWALAFVSKQTAFWFLIPITIEIMRSKKNLKDFIAGSLMVAAPSLLIMWAIGVLPAFVHWGLDFGIFVLPKAQGQVQLPDLKNLAISLFPFTVFVPLILMRKKESFSLALWSLAGMMGAYPRFEYFHFQPAIPYLAIATALVFLGDWHKKDLVKAFIPIYVLGSLYLFGGFFIRNFGEGTRFYEPGVLDVVTFVKLNTKTGDRIFVLNYWDNIYPLSGTLPATRPWVPQLSWYMERPGIQDKIVADLKKSKPAIIILNPYSQTGLGAYKPKIINDYIEHYYKIKTSVGVVQILQPK